MIMTGLRGAAHSLLPGALSARGAGAGSGDGVQGRYVTAPSSRLPVALISRHSEPDADPLRTPERRDCAVPIRVRTPYPHWARLGQ
jgi:hypothetical protein